MIDFFNRLCEMSFDFGLRLGVNYFRECLIAAIGLIFITGFAVGRLI